VTGRLLLFEVNIFLPPARLRELEVCGVFFMWPFLAGLIFFTIFADGYFNNYGLCRHYLPEIRLLRCSIFPVFPSRYIVAGIGG